MTEEHNKKSTGEPSIKSRPNIDTGLRIIGVLILLLYVAALLVLGFTDLIAHDLRKIALDHFRTIVALPVAGVFALLVVSIFQVTSGNIEFNALGFKLKGAAGPILMWIIAYAVIAITIYKNW
jgi:hypothetical protein